jgi:hypothetical protein
MMLARKLPYFNTKTLTLNLGNLELQEGFRDLSYACELVGKSIKSKAISLHYFPKFLLFIYFEFFLFYDMQ